MLSVLERFVIARGEWAAGDADQHLPKPCSPTLLGQDIRRACRRGRRHAFHGLLLGLERDAITRHAMSFAGLKLPPGFRRRRPLALLGAGLHTGGL